MSAVSRRGFTLVEALLSFGVTFVLMAVLYTLLVSSRRGMARGEGKLEYIGEANALFQSLKMDVQALTKPPIWNDAASELKLQILRVERKPNYHTVTQTITYKLEGQTVHRRSDATGPQAVIEHRQFGLEKMKSFTVSNGKLKGSSFLSTALVFKLENEPMPTEFSKVLFLKNIRLDRTWNPLPEP